MLIISHSILPNYSGDEENLLSSALELLEIQDPALFIRPRLSTDGLYEIFPTTHLSVSLTRIRPSTAVLKKIHAENFNHRGVLVIQRSRTL